MTGGQVRPIPELVDFRITGDKKQAVLFIREGTRFYRRHLRLTREGAGLHGITPTSTHGQATFTRHNKRVSCEAVSERAFDRYILQKFVVVGVSQDMTALLASVFWGGERAPVDGHALEGVQAALANAAD